MLNEQAQHLNTGAAACQVQVLRGGGLEAPTLLPPGWEAVGGVCGVSDLGRLSEVVSQLQH